MKASVLSIFPNGEFTVGLTREISTPPTEELEASHRGFHEVEEEHMMNGVIVNNSLSLRNSTNRHRLTHSRKRSGKRTRKANRLIRSAIYCLGAKALCSFTTLTLPELTEEIDTILFMKADNVIRVFNQRLKRLLTKRGLPGEIVCVREYTEKGNLHWHLVFQGKARGGDWVVSPAELSEIWGAILSSQLGIEIEAKVYMQRVWSHSVQALELYLTETKKHEAVEGKALPAGRSYNISASLRKKAAPSKSEELAPIVYSLRNKLRMDYLHEIKWNGKTIGLSGRLKYGLSGLLSYVDKMTA